jgi:hypothetical protein
VAAGTSEIDLFFENGKRGLPPTRFEKKRTADDMHAVAMSHAEITARRVTPDEVRVVGAMEPHGPVGGVNLGNFEPGSHPAVKRAGPEKKKENES